MNNKKIEKIIRQEVDSSVPDVFENIEKMCNGREINMKKEKKVFPLKGIITAVSFAVVALVVGLVTFSNMNTNIMSTVMFDVNPSISIKVDKNNNIAEANAINVDGKKILDNMDLKGTKLNIAVNAIVGSMYKNGYISDIKNSILVTVDSNDKNTKDKLQKEISNTINEALNVYKIESAIISQEYDVDDEIERKAKEYGISLGKAELLEKIIESNLTNKNGKKYTFEDLVNLNINELNVILSSKNKNINNVTTSGNASTKAYIDYDKAKSIALNSAGVTNINDYEIELDYEYGMMIYEVSFISNGKEYDYEINATTGEIINSDQEYDDDYNPRVNNATRKTTPSTTNSSIISRNKAKSIALNNAGVSNVRGLSIELDSDNNKMIYEVDFEYANKDYEYDIDAYTGAIINKKIEVDD